MGRNGIYETLDFGARDLEISSKETRSSLALPLSAAPIASRSTEVSFEEISKSRAPKSKDLLCVCV